MADEIRKVYLKADNNPSSEYGYALYVEVELWPDGQMRWHRVTDGSNQLMFLSQMQ